ncbi:hydantoinase/oxoprolinase family protein [Roseomonas sp. E05]|uniref:hydantoinase/oxoprolinase family protein n=1 Tax=Roseomonas sp. E05 TaxID=3046310 RepID=UPI0024B95185|nr:hydantoinase/oxoprolinase family protein [Roseomonas sp. E05]MDJ0388772.1 hydantoinase/oxoprolinase family protein [Roseomonas sp. E05]
MKEADIGMDGDRGAVLDCEIGIDIGGTFTDIVCRGADGRIRLMKVPSTRGNPSRAVLAALERARTDWNLPPQAVRRLAHGTTVATNAVLERKGARIGLITTEGFRDVLEIGRQKRAEMYDLVLRPQTPVFLAPGAFRKEVRERLDAEGHVVTPLDEDSVRRAADELVAQGAEAIAVCLLFSFRNPAHERRVAELIAERQPGLPVSLSCEVDPAFREYERSCVTAFDSYVKPVVANYLADMEQGLASAGVPAPMQVMQSRGGLMSSAIARQRPVRLFLSGPAAGVVGGLEIGRMAGLRDLITVDIGGTSCDIALIAEGEPLIRAEGYIDGYTVRVPMVDVTAIGSGGGSLAWLDGAGTLRVGPESAGSEPGPACYGRGGERPTVTDASVALGYIDPQRFAGGTIGLRPELAVEAIRRHAAEPLGLSVEQAALGIHRVVNAQMAEAIRLVSIGRGIDPRGFALLPLGGGGPMHATALAEELGVTTIIVPPHPGVLAAAGALGAPVEHEVSLSVPMPLDEAALATLRPALDELEARSGALMAQEGVAPEAVETRHFLDLCYTGQSYHLEVPFDPAAPDAIARAYRDFLAVHDRVYGHSTENPARVVNLRVVKRAAAGVAAGGASWASSEEGPRRRAIWVRHSDTPVEAEIWPRAALRPGLRVSGPAIVEQQDTTTLVEPGWSLRVGPEGVLLIEKESAA